MRKQFERAGRLLSYLEAPGSAADAAGPVLVLLHAFPLSAEMWEPQLAAAPPGWRLVAPDLAGFGESFPVPPTATVDDDAADVLALLDRVGARSAVVAGLSMGGYVALALVRLAASRVRGLVLADTRAEADTVEASEARRQMLASLERGGTRSVIDAMLPRLLGRTTLDGRPDLAGRVRELGLKQSRDGVRAGINRLMTRPDSTPLLSSIACPALVAAGSEDLLTGPDVARQLHRRIPGSTLCILDGAGHLSSLEQPALFNSALSGFLSRHLS